MKVNNWLVDGMTEELCGKCEGTGKVVVFDEGIDDDREIKCERCGGSGVIQK